MKGSAPAPLISDQPRFSGEGEANDAILALCVCIFSFTDEDIHG